MREGFWVAALAATVLSGAASARDVGEVSTGFKLLGPNHKIVITAFEDPKIAGVSCYVARPRTGGLRGAVGIAEDPSIASVSCVQTGPISFNEPISDGESGEGVFDERRSLIFKSLEIDRIFDKTNGSLVYVARTTRIIDGSPATSLSVVAPITWNGTAPSEPKLR
ncbi:CreA family protein [Aureimonas psammosilenae]|uniref:CreA family protein n=1 Tax=Aureimonas psammosilenae TaxID=2495496 RepID=UPI00126050AC|nr:CreA family protein [Aureimonas psammosilenae]